MVNISTKEDGIHLRHCRTLDFYSATAESIVKALLGQFDEYGIYYKRKLIATMTGGCNTMQGNIYMDIGGPVKKSKNR